MNTDIISDMLTRIRNSLERKTESVEVPYSKEKESIVKVFKDANFIKDYKVYKMKESVQKTIKIDLLYDEVGFSKIQEIKRISKSGLRVYKKYEDIKPILGGIGMEVISTSKGVMTSKEAKKRKLGGEVICSVY